MLEQESLQFRTGIVLAPGGRLIFLNDALITPRA